MLNFSSFELSSEQQDLIPVYRSKWQSIALSNETINRASIATAINAAYDFINLEPPNILFFSNPSAALEYIYGETQNNLYNFNNISLGHPVAYILVDKLLGNIRGQLKNKPLEQALKGNLDEGLTDSMISEIITKIEEAKGFSLIVSNISYIIDESAKDSDANTITKTIFKVAFRLGFIFIKYFAIPISKISKKINQIIFNKEQTDNGLVETGVFLFTGKTNKKNQYRLPLVEITSRLTNVFIPPIMADYGYYIDYCHNVLHCDRDENKWNIFYNLITNSGWIFSYKKVAIVCERHSVE